MALGMMEKTEDKMVKLEGRDGGRKMDSLEKTKLGGRMTS